MRSMIFLALVGLPNLALAVDVDPFEPAGSLAHGNGGLATESATLAGPGIAFGLMGAISNDLMVIRFPSSGDENPYVENAFNTTLYAGYTYEDKFRIELFAPVYLGVNAPGVSYRGAAMGDMVLQGNIPLWQLNDAFNLAVLPGIGLPTGSKQALMHQGVSGRVKVAMSGTFDFGYWDMPPIWERRSPKKAQYRELVLGLRSTYKPLSGTHQPMSFDSVGNMTVALVWSETITSPKVACSRRLSLQTAWQ